MKEGTWRTRVYIKNFMKEIKMNEIITLDDQTTEVSLTEIASAERAIGAAEGKCLVASAPACLNYPVAG